MMIPRCCSVVWGRWWYGTTGRSRFLSPPEALGPLKDLLLDLARLLPLGEEIALAALELLNLALQRSQLLPQVGDGAASCS